MNSNFPPEGYDELLLLARDSRQRRRRTNWITMVAIVGAMGLSAAYVFSNQPDPASPNGTQAGAPPIINFSPVYSPTIEFDSGSPRAEESEPARLVLEQSFAGGPDGGNDSTTNEVTQVMRVYLLEGSRRVPMAPGDIVWIPEIRKRVTLVSFGAEEPTLVSVQGDNVAQVVPAPASATWPLPVFYPILTTPDRGNSNCVRIESLGPSSRAQTEDVIFIDLDISFEDIDSELCIPPE